METLREDASGTPLLVHKQQETTIDMEPAALPSMAEECEPGDRSGFTKKKLSMTRNVNLVPIIVPQAPVAQPRNSHLYTPQANSPLRQFSLGHQGLGSADLQHAYKSIISIRVYLPHLFKEEGEDKESTCVKVEVNRATMADEITRMIAENQDIDKEAAQEAFALWMISPLLELQLKPHHQPCELRKSWSSLLLKFAADATPQDIQNDEPLLFIKRRVQLAPERELELADDPKILKLLYVDAKCNLFAERFFMNSCDAAALAGLGYAIDYKETELTADFIRKNLEGQLPERLADSIRGPMMFGKSLSNGRELETVLSTWKENKGKSEQEKKKLYLAKLHQSCQQYGSAFFHGFLERPSVSPLKNLKRFFQSVASGDADMPITIGINRETITVVDSEKKERILVVQIADCVWKKVLRQGAASMEDLEATSEAQPSLLLHFPEFEGAEKKLNRNQPSFQVLQIFGYQTALIHCMLSNMHDLLKNGSISEPNSAKSSSSSENGGRTVNRTPSLTKCDRMCLATFVNGECVKASGSMKKIMEKVGKMQAAH